MLNFGLFQIPQFAKMVNFELSEELKSQFCEIKFSKMAKIIAYNWITLVFWKEWSGGDLGDCIYLTC